mmetsp:Transcript_26435/g.26687  ORF Transcript_26435/g.26687 Transcript_26435/m.26687 type:complete len:412 (-) Transcript_26435:92-1327(-)
MLGLANYESDESVEEGDELNSVNNNVSKKPGDELPPASLAQKKTVSTSATFKPKSKLLLDGKKRKKLDVTFLPPEIQKALARGAHTNDSDSDDDYNANAPKANKFSGNLLSMLPKPKLAGEALSLNGMNESRNQTPALVDVDDNKKDSNSKLLKSTKHLVQESYASDESDEDDGHHPNIIQVKTSLSLPTKPESLQIQQQPFSSVSSSVSQSLPIPSLVHRSISTAPHVPTNTNNNNTNTSIYSSISPHSTAHTPLYQSSSSTPLSIPQEQQQQLYTAPHHIIREEEEEKGHSGSSGKTARKRERERQQELLSGNISVINDRSCISVQASTQHWNPNQYENQQKREAQLNSVFNFGQKGKDGMIAQPTKLQNKRHQINSLAFNAAQIELELLDAKGTRMKTKSETQAKYGW